MIYIEFLIENIILEEIKINIDRIHILYTAKGTNHIYCHDINIIIDKIFELYKIWAYNQ